MFTELTTTEAKALDHQLFMAERDAKSRMGALAIMKRTPKTLAKLESYAGIVSDLYGLRDDLLPSLPMFA